MKDRISRLSSALGQTGAAIAGHLPAMPRLDLTSAVEIEIYLLHHGAGPDDYEILCDFDRFFAENQSGLFVRPVLKIWAGRRDFDRGLFAHRLRAAFTEQFEIVRLGFEAAQREKREATKGILALSPLEIAASAFGLGASLLGMVVLYLAVSAGRSAIDEAARWFRESLVGRALTGRSALSRLEEQIDAKRQVIDAALKEIDIRLHRELCVYAYRQGGIGPLTGLDYDAWPLPGFIREHMERE